MFDLPDLPYAEDALSPVISERTLKLHHAKHHATYVKVVNELLEEAGASPDSLETVIRDARAAANRKLFNNAAQAWNHSFFWVSMTADPSAPPEELASALDGAFGDLAGLKKKFVEAGAAHFGSGWVWLLVDRGGALQVRTTHDADDTVTEPGLTPLIVCDLWEHAYYLDHQNDRKGFLEAWFDALPNWPFAARQYAAARGHGQAWRHPAPAAEPSQHRTAAA